MRKFAIFLALALFISTSAWATETKHKKPKCKKPTTYSHSSSTAASLSYSGGSSSSSSNSMRYEQYSFDRVKFTHVHPANLSIGEASKPVMQWYVQGHTEKDDFTGKRVNALQVGVSGPISWGWKDKIDKSLGTEEKRLADQVRHQEERHQLYILHQKEHHQADMALMCIELHQMLERSNIEVSQELKQRCTAFEHMNNNATQDIIARKYGQWVRHSQEKDGRENPNQVMPHTRPYTK